MAMILSPRQLPRETLRDVINDIRLDFKFRYVPFRGYYRYRSHKYMTQIDPEMGILKFIIDPASISLDVGANLGLFTYFLARYCPHVHAFEPNPIPFRILKSVADKNVTLYQMALTDHTDEVKLVVPKGRKGWSSNGARLDRGSGSGMETGVVTVPGSRIDDLGLTSIGFIKIDVEGHEKNVLAGATKILKRDRPNLFIENEFAHAGDKATEVFSLLESLDYRGFFLENGVLRSLSRFSVEDHQIRPREGGAGPYVKNFIFLPK
jgi:FkbM family methyltransferase